MGSHKLLSLRFLREVCPAGADGFAALTPQIVIGYVERHALDGSADSGKAMCGVVRAFLRYLHLKGFISTALADACCPSAAGDLPAFQHSCRQRRSRRFSMPVIGRRQWGIGTMRF